MGNILTAGTTAPLFMIFDAADMRDPVYHDAIMSTHRHIAKLLLEGATRNYVSNQGFDSNNPQIRFCGGDQKVEIITKSGRIIQVVKFPNEWSGTIGEQDEKIVIDPKLAEAIYETAFETTRTIAKNLIVNRTHYDEAQIETDANEKGINPYWLRAEIQNNRDAEKNKATD